MNESTQKIIAQWISKVLLALGESGRGGIRLFIDDPDGRKDLIDEWAITGEKQADRLALEIEHEAQQQADGTGKGVHHFKMQAYRDADTRHFMSRAFIVASENAPDEDHHGRSSEHSLLAQNQRHLEALMKISAQKDASYMHAMSTMVQGLADRLNQYDQNALQQQQITQHNVTERAKLEFDVETRKTILRVVEAVGAPVLMKMIDKWMTEEKKETIEQIPPQTIAVLPAEASKPTIDVPSAAVIATGTPKNGHAKKRSKRP